MMIWVIWWGGEAGEKIILTRIYSFIFSKLSPESFTCVEHSKILYIGLDCFFVFVFLYFFSRVLLKCYLMKNSLFCNKDNNTQRNCALICYSAFDYWDVFMVDNPFFETFPIILFYVIKIKIFS